MLRWGEATEHWLEILKERDKIKTKDYEYYSSVANKVSLKLQNFISAIYKVKNNNE